MFLLSLLGASSLSPFSVGSSILALKRSTKEPSCFSNFGLHPGIALACM